ncbi:hypothetical protein [Kitasatospora sp. NPDC059817]|uniref:hypothetical protein n=1 Tax=unclassified Kitasatospora TaxID=2633591 RepID=UPI003667AAF2
MRIRHAVATVTLAATAALTMSTAASAAPAPRLACGVSDQGLPGNIYNNGVYVGQVEQQYDSCSQTAIAHFQWSGGFQGNGSQVKVYLMASNGYAGQATIGDQSSKDVYGYVNIHATSPDIWTAVASLDQICPAYSTQHDYSNGASLAGPQDSNCSIPNP